MLQQIVEIVLDKDTNNYKNRTGSRTYEASMILKEYGADNVQATEFLKEEYEEYQLKTKIMANSETPYYGVVVCSASEEDIIEREGSKICHQYQILVQF